MRGILHTSFVAVMTSMGLFGCDSPEPFDATGTYPVEGRVTFEEDGQPVVGALVSFSALEGTTSASALTGEDGRYDIQAGQGAGLPPGDYRVVVGPPLDPDPAITPLAVDPKYGNKLTSGLNTTINPLDNHYDIVVKHAAP